MKRLNGSILMSLAIAAIITSLSSCSNGSEGEFTEAPTPGVLKVNVVLVGPAADSSPTRSASEDAMKTVALIYSRVGIGIDPQWVDFAGGDEIADPRTGDNFFAQISQATRKNAVNVVLALKVAGLSKGADRYGLAPAIPGPTAPGPQSAIAISILEITGNDGRFDLGDRDQGAVQNHNDEKRLLAEEIGRQIAHYLGVSDIVQLEGTKIVGTDSLSDTPSCLTETDCRYDNDARHNLLFPYPLRDFDRNEEFYTRDSITAQQAALMKTSPLLR